MKLLLAGGQILMECNDFLKRQCKSIYIKQPMLNELDYVQRLWADELTTKEIGGPFILNDEDKEKFYNKMVNSPDNTAFYCVIYNLKDEPVGEVSFSRYDERTKTANFNIKIEYKHRGNGYSKEAMDLLLDYYFNEFGGLIMSDDIAIANLKAQQIFIKYGFEHVFSNEEVFLVRLTKNKFNEVGLEA